MNYLSKYFLLSNILNKENKCEIIRQRVEENFEKYKNNPKYESFIELFQKSEMVIESGSKESFNIIPEDHEKNISEIPPNPKITLGNSNKIFFFDAARIFGKFTWGWYQFLNENFEDNMKFSKSNSFEDFFEKNSNYK